MGDTQSIPTTKFPGSVDTSLIVSDNVAYGMKPGYIPEFITTDFCPEGLDWDEAVKIKVDYGITGNPPAKHMSRSACENVCKKMQTNGLGDGSNNSATCEFYWSDPKAQRSECVIFSKRHAKNAGMNRGHCGGVEDNFHVPQFSLISMYDDIEFDAIRKTFSFDYDEELIVEYDFRTIDQQDFNNAVDTMVEVKECPSEDKDFVPWENTIGVKSGEDVQTFTKDQCKYACTQQGESCQFAMFRPATIQPIAVEVYDESEEVGECVLFSHSDTYGKKNCPEHLGNGDGATDVVFLVKEYALVTKIDDSDMKLVGGIAEDIKTEIGKLTGDGFATPQTLLEKQSSWHCRYANWSPNKFMVETIGREADECHGPHGPVFGECKDIMGKCKTKSVASRRANELNAVFGCGKVTMWAEYTWHVYADALPKADELPKGKEEETFWQSHFKEIVMETLDKNIEVVSTKTIVGDGSFRDSCSLGYRKMQIFDKGHASYKMPPRIEITLFQWQPSGEAVTAADFEYDLNEYTADFATAETSPMCSAEMGVAIGAAGLALGFVPVIGTVAGVSLGVAGLTQAVACGFS